MTERNQLEEQLRQAHKMEAVGRLAGGIAHDFNNILTAVKGNVHLMLLDIPAEEPLRQDVEEIGLLADRAAELTRQLLAFSRKQVLQLRVVDLNHLVAGTEKMLRRVMGEDVELETELDPALGRVRVDAGQMEQVLMNLAVNARDAMRLGGTLRIESRNAGEWVLLRISDTGCGMDAATRARAFEPFFTTKGIGDGTGLGLSTVYAIVERLGGRIELRSEVGLGTSLAIYLPRTEETRAGEAPSAPIHGAEPPATGTVLLLEDDDAVRSWTRRILERSGYSVLEARNPSEAIRTAQDTGWPIDLLLADVVLPGGSGCSVAAELLAERPGLPVLYMSGYTDEAIIHLGVLDGTTPFLQKPFDPDALTKKVRELLVTR